MEQQRQDQDLAKLKELLHHTSEFIAYLELAESKMIAQQHYLERQTQVNNQTMQQQLQALHNELAPLQDLFKQTSLSGLTQRAELALKEGETHLALLQKTGEQLLMTMKMQQLDFNVLVTTSMKQIEQQTTQAIKRIANDLSHYDINHFQTLATNRCEQIEHLSSKHLQKNTRLLQLFQRRTIALVLVTTIMSSFAIGLYISNELPWESHQHAMNEREAGKTLIKAWPNLTQEEKDKILNRATQQKS